MLKLSIRKIVYTAVCLALALVLPFMTGQIPQIGNMLCPMHIPIFLCGFLCGWPYGITAGFLAPVLRFVIFGMPPLMPIGFSMALELATYGFVSGILYKHLPKTNGNIYLSLIVAMFTGRVVWGAVRFVIAGIQATEFTFSAFIAGAITNAIPGIAVHIFLIPIIVIALKKAKVVLND